MFVKIIEITHPDLVANLHTHGWTKFSVEEIQATIADAHAAANEQSELFEGELFKQIADYAANVIGQSVDDYPVWVDYDNPFWKEYDKMMSITANQVIIDSPRKGRKGTQYNVAKWQKIIATERRKTERTKKAVQAIVKKYITK